MIENKMIAVDKLTREQYNDLLNRRGGPAREPEKDWYYVETLADRDGEKERVVHVRKVYRNGGGPIDNRKLSEIVAERQQERATQERNSLTRRLDDEVSDMAETNPHAYKHLPLRMQGLIDEGKDLSILLQAVQWLRVRNITKWEKPLKATIATLEAEQEDVATQQVVNIKKGSTVRENQEKWKSEALEYDRQIERGVKQKQSLTEMVMFSRTLMKNGYNKRADFPLEEWEMSQEVN